MSALVFMARLSRLVFGGGLPAEDTRPEGLMLEVLALAQRPQSLGLSSALSPKEVSSKLLAALREGKREESKLLDVGWLSCELPSGCSRSGSAAYFCPGRGRRRRE